MTSPSSAGVPPIITGAGEILARYEVLFCDVWGVVHNGIRAYAAAVEALERFRAGGGSVILLTNAPVPIHRVEAMLEARRVPQLAYDTIVSSGEIALQHMREAKYSNVYFIGPRERDAAFFARAGAANVPLEAAEAIVCTGLNDDVNETVESYRDVLDEGIRRDLPFVCANPDLVVDVGGRLFLCAGALADAYAHQGGTVFWAGKPHASAYAAARAAAARLRGAPSADDKILVIGDAIRTDLAGAKGAGLDALFVAGGIHREEAMDGARIDPEKLALLFPPGTPPALAAMGALAW
jgi:HAD superfamily hydrolase (TIGR01459 family)